MWGQVLGILPPWGHRGRGTDRKIDMAWRAFVRKSKSPPTESHVVGAAKLESRWSGCLCLGCPVSYVKLVNTQGPPWLAR